MEQTNFSEWAIIDLFGHQKIAGRVSDAYKHYLYDGSVMILEMTKHGMKGVLPLI